MTQLKSSQAKESKPSGVKSLYEEDFAVWVEQMVQLLKQGKLDELDIENLIEEVEDLGKSQKRELKSNLRILLMHLLKWQYQPNCRSLNWNEHNWNENSGARIIIEHRSRIQDLLLDSPSLHHALSENLVDCYKKARLSAAKETGLDLRSLPEACTYTEADILNDEFWPE